LLSALVALLLTAGCDHAPEIVQISGSKFGTSYNITIVADQPAPADLAEQIDEVLDVVDLAMSTYKSESELSLFNRLPAGKRQGRLRNSGLSYTPAVRSGNRALALSIPA